MEDNLGWCTWCEDFTNSGCEPDARKYQCDECENHTVYGAEEALIEGLIMFSEEPPDDEDVDFGDDGDID